MMMTEILQVLQSASPVGLATLLAVILYLQVKTARTTNEISGNHLSGLPGMESALDRIAATLDRIEERQVRICDQLTYLTARLNGGKSPM